MVSPSAEPFLGSEVGDGPALDENPRGLHSEWRRTPPPAHPALGTSKSPNQTTLMMTTTARTNRVCCSLRLRPGGAPLGDSKRCDKKQPGQE
jgi:hypothetical protein